MPDTAIDWTLFLGRPAATIDPEIIAQLIRGKRVLITGAGGSIGSALALALAAAGAGRLTLLDIAERGLFELGAELEGHPGTVEHQLIVGDVCDTALLREIFAEHSPHVVFHAAACKHVPLTELNPFAAVRSNILGTHRLLAAASEARTGQVVVLSTDKAVDPVGMMGATKRIAEMLVLSNGTTTQVKSVRLANVLGSSGSVVPTFVRQVARGGPVTITDAGCTRYFLSMDWAVAHLLSALAADLASTVLVPESGEPFSILAVARFVLERVAAADHPTEIVYTGLRTGEKLVEEMVARDESLQPTDTPLLRHAVPFSKVSASTLSHSIQEIEAAVDKRDLTRLLSAIVALLPAYEPSRRLQEQAAHEAKLIS